MYKSKNLSLLLSDNHLTEHVAGTEEILKADLVRIPPENEFLHIFEFIKVCQANIAICKSANLLLDQSQRNLSPPWPEDVNPATFSIPLHKFQ